MSLNNLKTDIFEMIKLSAEIAKYNQMLLHHNDLNDKRNYDINKCDKIKTKLSELQKEFYFLTEKWFES